MVDGDITTNVPSGQTSSEGAGSTAGQTPQALATPTQPAIDPAIQKIIADAVAQQVAAIRETGRRELQSQQDKNRAEAERYARQARGTQTVLDETFRQVQQLDPETAEKLELARLRAERQSRTQQDQEEATRQEQTAFHQQFYNNMAQMVQSMGLDVNDPRIDWGQDAANYFEAQRRIADSAQKIQKTNYDASLGSIQKQLSDLQEKLKAANIEVNSVPAGTPPGVASNSDSDFVAKFASGEIPLSKANIERYNKLLNSQ